MGNWGQWIFETLGIGHSLQYKIVMTIVIVLVVYLVRKLLLHFLLKNVDNVKSRYNWSKSFSYFSYFLVFIIVIPVWFEELHAFGTFFGLLTAGLAIALKDPISNFFAWIYITFKKPFQMGDRIQIDNSEGDILDISFFEFTLLEIKNWVKADQSTGRIIHIPNGLLFTKPVINYNQAMDYIWNEVPVTVTFESNWGKAKKILLEIEINKLKPLVKDVEPHFDKAQKKYFVNYNNLDPTVYTRIMDNGILLTLRYLCPPKSRRDIEQLAYEEILIEFAKHEDIHFAYPTTRFYNAKEEMK